MVRRFRQHELRQVIDLSGIWEFTFLGDNDYSDIESIVFDDRMMVPGSFDATPGYAGRRGLSAYRTTITLADESPHRLVFDSVHHWCRVYVDGQLLAEHGGGFTRFHVDLTGHMPGEKTLIVLVDNRFDTARSPLHEEYFDWYHFGGITRPVELHRLGTLWIDRLRVVTKNYQTREISVTVDYRAVGAAGPVELVVSCDGVVILNESHDLHEPAGQIIRTLRLPGAKLWSPDSPNLHLLAVRLGGDDMQERIGIRQVRADGQRILINNEPVRLLGFNRHEAHPEFGHSIPLALHLSDLQQFRDMGCNFVRGSHYPQDERFLDLCDEMGFCVWDEATGWQQTAEHLTNPVYIAAAEQNIDEMMTTAFNHPSVILWGLLNEGHSHDPACVEGYRTLIERMREQDTSRLITYATNHPFDDLNLDAVDVLAVNTYPGWYHGDIADIPAHLMKIAAHLDTQGHEGKPLIISEIGAGAVPGWRDWNETRWSEQYQAQLLEQVIRSMFVESERFCGLAIWQFCDIRTSQLVSRVLGRPRAFNNKGVVDEYRRPKLAYDVVKRLFRQLQA